MYSETRQYVLRRADSVKQLGTAVLDSRVTAVTATALDRALTTADKYVDKYLPPDNQDAVDGSYSLSMITLCLCGVSQENKSLVSIDLTTF